MSEESLILGREVEGDGWEFGGEALELVNLLSGGADMILGNLDKGLGQTDHKGVRLSACPLVVVAKNDLKAFGAHQIGKRDDVFHRDAALDEDRSGKAQMLTLLVERARG